MLQERYPNILSWELSIAKIYSKSSQKEPSYNASLWSKDLLAIIIIDLSYPIFVNHLDKHL